MLILKTERRQAGRAYAGLVFIATGQDEGFTLVLQHHPAGRNPWQSSFYQTPADGRLTEPLWRSMCREAATQAIDELFNHIAHLDLPDDLYGLVTALLPELPIRQPTYSLS